jgi:hypothetical protein
MCSADRVVFGPGAASARADERLESSSYFVIG